jgi:hypothetical protein
MKDFQRILEECLTRLSNGTATVDECLARYSEHAEQLKPLLQTVSLLKRGREVVPSPTFTAFARFALIEHARAHPRQQRAFALSWRMAMPLAMLVVALLVTGTVHAQSALPGDIDYGWKRTSEVAWRALAPDPVAADIILAERRLNEWIAVANDPALSTGAMNSYQDALSKLKSTDDVEALALIVPVLQSQQRSLNDAGLSTSTLDDYLIEATDLLPVKVPTQITPTEIVPTTILMSTSTHVAPTTTDVPPTVTDVPPTATDIPPTATDIPPTATEVPPTATEVPPTEVPPTEVPPTEVPPTEVPPTEAPPTEAPPTEAPPTEAPPTEAPPTEAPPTNEPFP